MEPDTHHHLGFIPTFKIHFNKSNSLMCKYIFMTPFWLLQLLVGNEYSLVFFVVLFFFSPVIFSQNAVEFWQSLGQNSLWPSLILLFKYVMFQTTHLPHPRIQISRGNALPCSIGNMSHYERMRIITSCNGFLKKEHREATPTSDNNSGQSLPSNKPHFSELSLHRSVCLFSF